MTTVTFDTLKFVRKLEAAGIQAPQAEATAEALAEALADELVSRQYLDLRLTELKHDLTLRMGGMMMGGIALVVTLIKLLPAAN